MSNKQPEPEAKNMGANRVPSSALLGWFLVSEKLPPCGAIISCRAPHESGRTMYWAGEVVEVWPQGFATIEVLGLHARRFILTDDTWWCLLSNLEVRDAASKTLT